jgi:hypothetical protein
VTKALTDLAAGTLADRVGRKPVLVAGWPTFGGGCHAHSDTRAAIEAAGFTIDDIEQLRIPETRVPAPTSPHIIGTATNPTDPQG